MIRFFLTNDLSPDKDEPGKRREPPMAPGESPVEEPPNQTHEIPVEEPPKEDSVDLPPEIPPIKL